MKGLIGRFGHAQMPYAGMSEQEIVEHKLHSATQMGPPPGCPEALAELMRACLDRQHTQRPAFAAIVTCLHALLAHFWSDE